jgi:hypothetical protein
LKGGLVAEQTGESPLVTDRFLVAMADTDATRVIYYGTPLRWAERLVTTWFVEVGFPTITAATGRTRRCRNVSGTPGREFEYFPSGIQTRGRNTTAIVDLTQVFTSTVDGELRATRLPAEIVTEARGMTGDSGASAAPEIRAD